MKLEIWQPGNPLHRSVMFIVMNNISRSDSWNNFYICNHPMWSYTFEEQHQIHCTLLLCWKRGMVFPRSANSLIVHIHPLKSSHEWAVLLNFCLIMSCSINSHPVSTREYREISLSVIILPDLDLPHLWLFSPQLLPFMFVAWPWSYRASRSTCRSSGYCSYKTSEMTSGYWRRLRINSFKSSAYSL